jgi:hypothetical protein
MQLTLALAAALLSASTSQHVTALPAPKPGLMTLPLHRYPRSLESVHPELVSLTTAVHPTH